MPRSLLLALGAILIAIAAPSEALASFANYARGVTRGSAYTMTSPTALFTGSSGSRRSLTNSVSGFSLPFTFVLDGVAYSRISVSTNGLISFGSNNVTSTGSNNLTSTSSTYGQFPRIAAWWDQLYVTGGAQSYCRRAPAVRHQTFGSSPDRVLVIDFRDIEVASRSVAFSSWQVRFYEGSNAIEFYYGNMTSLSCRYGRTYSTSATIGIADASNDFISVTPNYSSATFSGTSVNNFNSLSTSSRRIPSGTIYYFTPCNIALAGDASQGGTALMAHGDTLFSATRQQRGDIVDYTPFTLNNTTSGCGSRNFTMSITGPHALEYSISTTGGTIGGGSSITPVITFNPYAPGLRRATLTVSDDNGYFRSFPLAATALTRMSLIPDLAQGGTTSLDDGDTLMRAIEVRRRFSGDFTPMTIANINPNPSQSPARVTFTIDSAGGISSQYEIVGASSVDLGTNESYTPVIRFNAHGIGEQSATLTVNADNDVRTYTLLATAVAPAITVTADGEEATPDLPVFNQAIACVGDVINAVPFIISNPGRLPLVVDHIDFYLTDTAYQQGTPMMPLLRDRAGRPIALRDYALSDVPGSIPLSSTPRVSLPFTVEPGAARHLYLTYIGQQPGKRFGRAFIRTNAENVVGVDTSAYDGISTMPATTLGLFTTDLVARAVGSRLAADMSGLRLKTLVLPGTRVGDTSEASLAIANTGACDLRVRRSQFRITSGDVHDITVLDALAGTPFDASTGDFVLAPGSIDTVRIRFVPSRSGTRMATLWIQTNDSSIVNDGIAERGAVYLDITGRGIAGLEARPLTLDPVVIGGFVRGVARVENSNKFPVTVSQLMFDGGDVAEFTEDDAAPWRALPFAVLPGEILELGVRLTPVGAAGPRRTSLLLITSTNDTIRVSIEGEAGTQGLVVSPTSLFDNVSIAAGQLSREHVMIANDGTLPVQIESIAITGADSASYILGVFPRYFLEAGQTELLEVTFAPTASGAASATLVVTTTTDQVYTVALGGVALRIRRDPADQVIAPTDNGAIRVNNGRATPTLR